MRRRSRRIEWTELGEEEIYRRGWLAGYDGVGSRMQEQKEDEELKKRVRRESERRRMVRNELSDQISLSNRLLEHVGWGEVGEVEGGRVGEVVATSFVAVVGEVGDEGG